MIQYHRFIHSKKFILKLFQKVILINTAQKSDANFIKNDVCLRPAFNAPQNHYTVWSIKKGSDVDGEVSLLLLRWKHSIIDVRGPGVSL